MFLGGVPAHEYRYETDESRQKPGAAQHAGDRDPPHDGGIFERPDDRVVPVHADAAEVEDRRGGEVNVQRAPHVAHDPAEHPLAGQLDGRVERHGANRDEKVRGRQADHVSIGRHAELPVPPDAGDHQHVADQGGHDDADDHHALDRRPDDVRWLVSVRGSVQRVADARVERLGEPLDAGSRA